MALRAGDLDRLVTILRYSVTYDGDNQPEEKWHPVDTVAASWRRAGSNERIAASQVSAHVTDVFEIRWTGALQVTDPKDRLEYEGLTYELVEVTETGRREGLLIRANAAVDTTP